MIEVVHDLDSVYICSRKGRSASFTTQALSPHLAPSAILLVASFSSLGLSSPILQSIERLGFSEPTSIQEQAIPLLLEGDRDFIGLAQTGTGKTAAFGLPLIEHLDPDLPHIQALILAPTRELGQQIAQQIELFAKDVRGIKTVAVYGGASIVQQIQQLRRPCQVVIATPGRLIDLVNRKALKLDQVQFVVLDEADEMLNMGFKEDLDTILDFTPESKRTWLFSATMPKEIRRMVKQYMDSPLEVRVDPGTAVNNDIEHKYAVVRHTDKAEALTRFIDLNADLFGVVFCRTKRDAQDLAEKLMKSGYRADALHGDLSQHQRDRVMNRFKRRELQLLIATDVAARGIDVNDVTHVFHYALPHDQAYYTHRAGRTARAGKRGISLAFINQKEKAAINRISRDLDIEFKRIEVPGASEIAAARVAAWADSIVNSSNGKRTPDALIELAESHFQELSKSDLIACLVGHELKGLSTGPDLNQSSTPPPYERRERRKSFKPGFDESAHKKKFGKKKPKDERSTSRKPYKPTKSGKAPFKPKY